MCTAAMAGVSSHAFVSAGVVALGQLSTVQRLLPRHVPQSPGGLVVCRLSCAAPLRNAAGFGYAMLAYPKLYCPHQLPFARL